MVGWLRGLVLIVVISAVMALVGLLIDCVVRRGR